MDLTEVGLPTGGTTAEAVPADFDGDGDLDLFVARADAYVANAYARNRGDGTFESVPLEEIGLALGSGVMSFAAAAGDLDRDGDLDLVVANGGISGRQDNLVALSDGTGHFAAAAIEARGLPVRGSNLDVVLADFDRDGRLDLLLTDVNPVGETVYALGRGDGTFRTLAP